MLVGEVGWCMDAELSAAARWGFVRALNNINSPCHYGGEQEAGGERKTESCKWCFGHHCQVGTCRMGLRDKTCSQRKESRGQEENKQE